MDLACQYGPTDAHMELKPHLLAWHKAKDGVDLKPEQIQVLTGAQEGLHIMAYLFLDPEDGVILSEPAYPGALGAFRAFTENFIPVPIDAEGMQTKELEKILEARKKAGQPMPKFIYEVPNGHNPAGVALSVERRRHLLEIASRFDLPVLEDDPYQLVQLGDRDPWPTLQSMDREGRVVRLDSFSKIFAPGLRLGYASGPAEIIGAFQLYKQGTNLHTSAMDQTLLTGFLAGHTHEEFRALIRENCRFYRANRDAMVECRAQAPARRHPVQHPQRGHVPVVRAACGVGPGQRLVETAGVALGVLLVPGFGFSTTGGLKNYMRASFSMATPVQIEEGIKRFAKIIENEKARL